MASLFQWQRNLKKDAYFKPLEELLKNTYYIMGEKQVFVYIRLFDFVIYIRYSSLSLGIQFYEF